MALARVLAVLVIALCVSHVRAQPQQACLDRAYELNAGNSTYIKTYYLDFDPNGSVRFLALISTSNPSAFCGANYTGTFTVSSPTISFNLSLAAPLSTPQPAPLIVAMCEDLINEPLIDMIVRGDPIIYAPADLENCGGLNFIPSADIGTVTFTAGSASFAPSLLVGALVLLAVLLM